MTWVKICGLTRQEDAELAAELGADALGFVFEPTSPRCVGPLGWLPDWLSRLTPEKVAVFGPVQTNGLSPVFRTLQGTEWPQTLELLGRRRQVVVRDITAALDRLPEEAAHADRVVLDAHHPSAYGGTGQTVDWGMASAFVAICPIPVVLAGGLTADNVAEAIRRVRPSGVDVSSGVELSPGVKDPAKLKAFFEAVQSVKPLP